MNEAELRYELDERTNLSPTLRASPGLLDDAERLPICIVCPAARWYRIDDDKGTGRLECFCTQFRGLMFDPPKRVVTACDGYADAIAG